jgi:type IV secretion system protein VirD4
MAGTTTVVDKKISISGGGGKGGKSRSVSIAETSRPLLTPDECLRLPGLSKGAGSHVIPGDMLIFTAGNPPIYGRQILYFLDPVFSARARVKALGVAEGWRRGLSDSLYFPMPLTGRAEPLAAGGKDGAVKAESECMENGDFADEYQKLLAES